MKEFEILGHTSEVMFRSYGHSLDEAFENAGKALFALMADLEEIPEEKNLTFSIESETLESLLYDFIDQLIYLRDSELMLFSGFQVEITETNSGYSLTAQIKGCDMGNITAQDVKSPTYSDIAVEQKDSGYVTQMVVDV